MNRLKPESPLHHHHNNNTKKYGAERGNSKVVFV